MKNNGVHMCYINQMTGTANQALRDLLNEKEQYKKLVEDNEQRIDNMLYMIKCENETITRLNNELQAEKTKHKKSKRKARKKYKDMKLELIAEVLLLKSKLYDEKLSDLEENAGIIKIIDYLENRG